MERIHKILAISGIRSEYDILYPVLRELQASNYDLEIVVSGAHLSEQHGRTEQRILSRDKPLLSNRKKRAATPSVEMCGAKP